MRRLALAVAVLMATATTVKAGVVTSFSGNTQPEIVTPVGTTQGFINFAVFNTAGGVAGDHYGTGLAGIDTLLAADGFSTTSSFLYLFQNVNIGSDIASGSVNVLSADVTGHGVLSGLGYSQVTGSANPFLGATAATAGNISPAVTGATQTEGNVTTFSGLVTPSLLTLNSSSLVATYSPALVGTGDRSALWGYTSDFAPTLALGSIQDSGVAANGVVPSLSAVPEPSTLATCLVGMMSFAAYAAGKWWRQRLA